MRNQKTAILAGLSIALPVLFVALICYIYLPLYARRFALSLGLLLAGVAVGFLCHGIVRRLPDRSWIRGTILTFVVAIALLPVVSIATNRITYSRFGFTVYGLMPIPFLDITVDPNGFLWFREKTHQITSQEINRLVDSNVEMVIIAIGWDSIAKVDDDVDNSNPAIQFRILPTPDAFALYNAMVAEGRVVVLLAHTTC